MPPYKADIRKSNVSRGYSGIFFSVINDRTGFDRTRWLEGNGAISPDRASPKEGLRGRQSLKLRFVGLGDEGDRYFHIRALATLRPETTSGSREFVAEFQRSGAPR